MARDRFMVAPLKGGLDRSVTAWQVTDDSFPKLLNCYMFRGRVRKRFGSRLMNGTVDQNVAQLYSRLRINIGTTDAVTGSLAATALPNGVTQLAIGQMFSIDDVMFTVNALGAPAATLTTDPTITASINNVVNPNTITITGNGITNLASSVYYYPATPVMGLKQFETADLLNDPTYAFDMQFVYEYTGGGWEVLGPVPPAAGSAIWTGSNSQFFWTTTWQGVDAANRRLFVVNNNAADQIKYWNPTAATWTTINPVIDAAGDTLETALILVAYKNHLIALNTTEKISGTDTTYTNRARYAAFGDPTSATAWRSDIPGKGNAIDASTMEDIVSCEFIKDRLVVFFEQSTWELVFSGNQAQPFTWQKLNTQLGVESPWSVVPFDKVALAIGNTGVHACNGVNVERVDNKIPDEIWNIHTTPDSAKRVYGTRDYFAQQVYWTFPNADADQYSSTFPNRVLVYNYTEATWALNDDSITVFGAYFAQTQSQITWDNTDITWDNTEITWGSGVVQPLNQDVLAGNQEGFVFIIDSNQTDNAPALQITNITAPANVVTLNVINHNFNVQDYIYIEWLNGLTGPFLPIYEINSIIDSNNFTIIAPDILGRLAAPASEVYTGGGTISRVSRIDILTKQFNFYVEQDRNVMIEQIEFLVDRTDSGAITIDYAISSVSPESDGMIAAANATGSLIGNSVLTTAPYALAPLESKQARLWHPMYIWADGQNIQLRLYLNNEQMLDYSIATSAFQLHAFCFIAAPTSSRLQ